MKSNIIGPERADFVGCTGNVEDISRQNHPPCATQRISEPEGVAGEHSKK